MKNLYPFILNFIVLLISNLNFGQAPGGVNGMSAWYRGDLGRSPYVWNDQSGNKNHLTAANSPSNDLLNFNLIGKFNGTNQQYNHTTEKTLWPVGGKSSTYYYVATQTDNATTLKSVISIGISGETLGFHSGRTITTATIGSSGSNNNNGALVLAPPSWQTNPTNLVRTGHNTNDNTLIYISANGGTETLSGVSYLPTYLNTAPFRIGADGNQSYFWNGNIAEVIVYPGKHSATEYNKIETYLAIKYGISKTGDYINSAGNKVWDATVNSNYLNNIAGIARDDNGTLYQKQSVSINVGPQLIISAGGAMAETNQVNTNSLNDGQFLIWGDNGMSKRPIVSIVGIPGIDNRFEAIWKVQNTGNLGTVRVLWPTGLTNLHLIQSSDETFDASDIVTNMSLNIQTVNGISYNYADVTLSDGQYFTFGSLKSYPAGVDSGLIYWFDAGFYANTSTWVDKNNGFTLNKIGNGSLSHSAGNAYSNFNPHYAFPITGSAHFAAPLSIPAATLGRVHTTFATGAKYGSIANPQNHIVRFSSSLNEVVSHRYGLGLNSATNIPTLYYDIGTATIAHPEGVPLNTMSLITAQISSITTPNNKSIMYNGNRATFSANVTQDFYENFQIGGGTYGFAGLIPEVIYYNTALSDLEIEKINSYLAIKYGITLKDAANYLNSNADIVWNGLTNYPYEFNIAGIARDDNGALYQKQSKSINIGHQVLIGAGGSLTDTNQSNTNSLNDGQFLIWGDNGLSKRPIIPFTGVPEVNNRFEAIWKVQNTGNVGTVRLMYPTGLHNLKLIQSTDENFDDTDTITDMSANLQIIDGIAYNYAEVVLNDGEYFTFLAFTASPGGVSTGLTYWFDAGSDANLLTWTDRNMGFTINKYDTSSFTLSLGDTGSNFNPHYVFPTNGNAYFYAESMIPPATLGVLNTTFAMGAKYGSVAGSTYGNIVRFANDPSSGSNNQFGIGLNATDNTPTLQFVFNGNLTHSVKPPSNIMVMLSSQVTSNVAPNNRMLSLNGSPVYQGMNVNNFNNYFQIGGGVQGFAGKVPEVIYYNSVLSTSEMDRVNTYLAIKYGVTLVQPKDYVNSGGNVVWDSSNNSDYNQNIAGIARDDNGSLYQKQSRSVNEGKQVLIGVGGALSESNTTNSNTLNDGQFLIWGDNGLTKRAIVPFSGVSDVNNRFEAIWKVQNTNNVGTVRVMWPEGLENIKLIQSLDPVFDNTDIITEMSTNTQTIDGITYNYADVSFTDGEYFTFLALMKAPGGVSNGLIYWFDAGRFANLSNWTDRNYEFTINKFGSGSIILSEGDTKSNFNPHYIFPNSGVSHFTAETIVPMATLGSLHTTFAMGAKSDNIDGYYNHIMRFGNGEGSGVNHQYAIGLNSSSNYPTLHFISNGANLQHSVSVPLNTMSLLGAQTSATTGTNNHMVSLNGSQMLFSFNITPYFNHFQIGGSTYGFAGKIPEVIYYNIVLNQSEIDRVNTYLAIKYGITLSQPKNYIDSGENIVWDATTNSDYNQNIAGIARDDNGALYQKQSMSINSGKQVLIGVGGALSDTNSNNVNTLDDGQFLIWGDNGLRKSASIPISGITDINYRFEAIWKVQNTNEVGTVRVMWPQGGRNIKLIQSMDPVFDNTDTITDMFNNIQIIDDMSYNYADVTLEDGQYFTFLVYEFAPGGVISEAWYRTDNEDLFSDDGFTHSIENTSVHRWEEFNEKNYPLIQSSTDEKPIFRNETQLANFHPSVNFDGSNDFLRYTPGNNIIDRNAGTLYVSGQIKTSSAVSGFFGFDDTMDYPGLHIFGSNKLLFYTTNFIPESTNSIPINTYFIGGSGWENGSGIGGNNSVLMSLTGYQQSWNNGIGNVNTDPSLNELRLGGDNNYGRFNGQLNESIVFGHKLSENEMNRVDSYIAIKYGITLDMSQGRNYLSSLNVPVWQIGINPNFNHNIFGIAHDGTSALNQKVSRSVNENTILTVATTKDFLSPNAHPDREELEDQEFLIFGDNNIHSGITLLDPEDCPLIDEQMYRLDKAWLVQETGNTGPAYLEVDLSDFDIDSEFALYYADDENFTMSTGIVPATEVNGEKAIFYFDFKPIQYFTIIGKMGPKTCDTCKGGKQTLNTAVAWFNAGQNGRDDNLLSDVNLSGAIPESGQLMADVTLSYPTEVEWLPTIFPRMYGSWVELSRYDNLSGDDGKITYTIDLKDADGAKAAKSNFQISGITKYGAHTTKVKITGYCGPTAVKPKLNHAYNYNEFYNNLFNRYTIDHANSTAVGKQPFYELFPFSTVNVDFEKVVDKIVIEWIVDRTTTAKHLSFLYISGMNFICDNPIEPVPDNVSISASYLDDELPTCEEATLRLQIINNNCSERTIDINNTLPAGLEYVPDSYVALDEEEAIYSGQNFSIDNLVVPPDISYIYIRVKPTDINQSGVYDTYFTFTVDGGINQPNPYRSDDDSGQPGYQDTRLTYTAATTIIEPTITKTVNTCFKKSSTELEYVISITNNDLVNNLSNFEFMDIMDANQTIASIMISNFLSGDLITYEETFVRLTGLSIAAGNTAEVIITVNTNDAYDISPIDTNGKKYFFNMAKITFDPNDECAVSNTFYSNELIINECANCTKDPNTDPATNFTKVGITTQKEMNGWPENVPNGFIVLESNSKGFIITRTTSAAINNPIEGMIIYDTDDRCIKLYNGTDWKCIERECSF